MNTDYSEISINVDKCGKYIVKFSADKDASKLSPKIRDQCNLKLIVALQEIEEIILTIPKNVTIF